MLNIKSYIVFSLVLSSCTTNKHIANQKNVYTREDINSMAEWKFGYDLNNADLCDLYMFDGIPYDNNGIDSLLSKYDKSEIGYISLVKPDESNTWFDRQCDLFTIISTKNQSHKEKRALLKWARNLFTEKLPDLKVTDFICPKCPILSIDSKLIENLYERKLHLMKLKPREIQFIVYLPQKLNPKYYGANSESGIIEIRLR